MISGFSFLRQRVEQTHQALSQALEGGHLIEPNGNYWAVFARDESRYFIGPYVILGSVEAIAMVYVSADVGDWSRERIVFEFLRARRMESDVSELVDLLQRFAAEIATLGPDDVVARVGIQRRSGDAGATKPKGRPRLPNPVRDSTTGPQR